LYPFDHRDVLSAYQNPRLLKMGGQKVVYRANHPSFGEVALKIGQYSSPQSLERIRREVTLLKDIDSEYYPKNYDFEVLPADRFVIIEEYIQSEPLTNCFADFREPEEVLGLIKHLVTGLKIIWDRRVVHRDMKPDNILIIPNSPPKIIDLGIARLLDFESLTRTLAMKGPCTPFYAAPEQLQNRKTEINFRADQFSLGIIMLQLLLGGEHPFDPVVVGSGSSTVENILRDNWARARLNNPDFADLRGLVTRLLGHEPYQRYRKDDILMSELDKALEVYS
jgi:eukaryotic-like serine/threonine-protein kinase